MYMCEHHMIQMEDDRLTESDEEETLLKKSDKKRYDDEAEEKRCESSDGNQHQPGTSRSSEHKGAFATTDSADSRVGFPQRQEDVPSCSSSSVDKACDTYKQNSSEKRSLSGSQENLSSGRPRKNVKFCHKFMKCFFPSRSSKKAEQINLLGHDFEQSESGGSIQEYDSDEASTLLGTTRTDCSTSATERKCNDESSSDNSTEMCATNHEEESRMSRSRGKTRKMRKGESADNVAQDVLPLSHFNHLPPQIATHIFSFLSVQEILCTAALVCKHWQRVSQSSCLWLKVNLRSHTSVTDEVLINLCWRHCSVGLLDLSDCLKITNDGFSGALSHCKVLRELLLIRCSQLTEGAFLSIAKNCLNLIHLDLSSCSGLTDQALQAISEQCPLLQKLRLKQCPLISDKSLQVVAQRCTKLKVLTFTDNDKITDATLEALAAHTHNLEILCLQNCRVHPPGVMQITKLRYLRKLDLSNLSTLTPEAVKQVAQHCTLLDTLNLSLSKDVSDDSVSCVAVSCQKLTTLFLISCAITDQALFSIGEHSTHLEHLDISWCTNITDHGAIFVSEQCPRLKYLGLIRCKKVSDTVVEKMVTEHPSIHYSTFLLDSKRLLDKAREQGFVPVELTDQNY